MIDPTSVTFDLFGDSAMPLAFCWIFSKLRAYCFVNDPGPSPGCSSRGGHIFKIQYWMYAATGGPNVKWGAWHHWPRRRRRPCNDRWRAKETTSLLRAVGCDMVVRKGPWSLQFDISVSPFKQKYFSLGFSVGEMEFHHCCSPWKIYPFDEHGLQCSSVATLRGLKAARRVNLAIEFCGSVLTESFGTCAFIFHSTVCHSITNQKHGWGVHCTLLR